MYVYISDSIKLNLCSIDKTNIKMLTTQSTDFSTNCYFLTIELAIGNNMPSVNIPSKGPAVIPDKLLPA